MTRIAKVLPAARDVLFPTATRWYNYEARSHTNAQRFIFEFHHRTQMALIWIPAALRDLTNGVETVRVEGKTVRQVIVQLDEQFPGMQDRLCDGDELRSGIAVAVGSQISSLGLLQTVERDTEVHFLPALSGGQQSITPRDP